MQSSRSIQLPASGVTAAAADSPTICALSSLRSNKLEPCRDLDAVLSNFTFRESMFS